MGHTVTVAYYGTLPDPDKLWQYVKTYVPQHLGVDVETHSISDITLLGVGICYDADVIVGNAIDRNCIATRRLNQLAFHSDDAIIFLSLTVQLVAV